MEELQWQKDKETITLPENEKSGDDMHERRNFGSWIVVLGCILILLGFSSACLADPGDGDRYPSAHIVVLNDDGDRYPSAYLRKF